MGSIFRFILRTRILSPIFRPLMRLIVGFIAIPLFRLFLKKVIRLQELDEELEKDLEQWFRGSLLLLVATANMEALLFSWVPPTFQEGGNAAWIVVGLRILLAIGVIEAMPDQELFAVIHPGPPKLHYTKERGISGYLREFRLKFRPICKGVVCQHLNRSSPVFAIMAAIFGGKYGADNGGTERFVVGWVCYGLAITQYLIIGLVTSRDKALDVLSEFDRQVAIRRRELIEEFDINASIRHERRHRIDPAESDRTEDQEARPKTVPETPDQIVAK